MTFFFLRHSVYTYILRRCHFHDNRTISKPLLAVSSCDNSSRWCASDTVGWRVAGLLCLHSLFTAAAAALIPFDRSAQFNELWSQRDRFPSLFIQCRTKPIHFLLKPTLIRRHCCCCGWWLGRWNQLPVRIDAVVDRHRLLGAGSCCSCCAAVVSSRCCRTIRQQLVDDHPGTGVGATGGSRGSRLMPRPPARRRLRTFRWSGRHCNLVTEWTKQFTLGPVQLRHQLTYQLAKQQMNKVIPTLFIDKNCKSCFVCSRSEKCDFHQFMALPQRKYCNSEIIVTVPCSLAYSQPELYLPLHVLKRHFKQFIITWQISRLKWNKLEPYKLMIKNH